MGLKHITSPYPPMKPISGYTRGKLESMNCLTNQAQMRNKGPIDEQSADDQILLGHRTPVAAVVTIVTIVAHREITSGRHRERTVGQSEVISPGTIAAVIIFRVHHPVKSVALRDVFLRLVLAFDVKQW